MLTGIGCAAVGMCIVGALLSPAGEESKMRADAGISFICELLRVLARDYDRHLRFSPLHGVLLLWFHASAVGCSLRLCVGQG